MKKLALSVFMFMLLANVVSAQTAAPRKVNLDGLKATFADASVRRTVVYNGVRITIPAGQSVAASENEFGNLVLKSNQMNLSMNNKNVVSRGPVTLVVSKTGKSMYVQRGAITMDGKKYIYTPAAGLIALEPAASGKGVRAKRDVQEITEEGNDNINVFFYISENLAAQQATQNKLQTENSVSPSSI